MISMYMRLQLGSWDSSLIAYVFLLKKLVNSQREISVIDLGVMFASLAIYNLTN